MSLKRKSEIGHSKNFLTPCRRIGLSRTKKTPKNINLNTSDPLSETYTVHDTTPVKSDNISTEVKKKTTLDVAATPEPPKLKKRKLDSSDNIQTYRKSTERNNLSELVVLLSDTKCNKPSRQKESFCKNSKRDQSITEKGTALDAEKINCLPNESAVKLKPFINNQPTKDNTIDETMTIKKKNFKRCLSLSLTKTESKDSPEKAEIESTSQGTWDRHSEEEILFPQDFEKESAKEINYTKANLLANINLLKSEIKRKNETVVKLKQAEVYKNKHDTLKLKELSLRWLEGCKLSLSDLLLQLKEHGPMSMDYLINKLNLPGDIIAKINDKSLSVDK